MNKVKIFSIYTEEAKELRDIFLQSFQDNWDVNLLFWGKGGENGNWGTISFGKLMRKKIEFILKTIKANWYDVIVIADIDIQFFGKCHKIIDQLLECNDILFQSENWPERKINAGFIVIKCNNNTFRFFENVYSQDIEHLQFFEQSAMNHILEDESIELKWDVLPSQFWAMSHQSTPPLDLVLHHANCTAPIIRDGKTINSIDLKMEQYRNVREFVLTNRAKVTMD